MGETLKRSSSGVASGLVPARLMIGLTPIGSKIALDLEYQENMIYKAQIAETDVLHPVASGTKQEDAELDSSSSQWFQMICHRCGSRGELGDD